MAGEDQRRRGRKHSPLEPGRHGKHSIDRSALGVSAVPRADDALVASETADDRPRPKRFSRAGIVHRRHVDEADEAAAGIVAQELSDFDDLSACTAT